MTQPPSGASDGLRAALDHDASDVGDGAAHEAHEHNYLCAEIGQRSYAIAADAVAEVTEVRPVTAIPHTPDYIPGVFTRRGRAVPLFDLARLLGEPQPSAARYVLVQAQKLLAGIPVARILGMRGFDSESLEPPLPNMRRMGAFIEGHFLVENAPILVLNIPLVLEAGRARAAGG